MKLAYKQIIEEKIKTLTQKVILQATRNPNNKKSQSKFKKIVTN